MRELLLTLEFRGRVLEVVTSGVLDLGIFLLSIIWLKMLMPKLFLVLQLLREGSNHEVPVRFRVKVF